MNVSNVLQFKRSEGKYFKPKNLKQNNKSPLSILNEWIKKSLVIWNKDLQRIIEDWDKNGEPIQPIIDIKKFEKITGFKYLGL